MKDLREKIAEIICSHRFYRAFTNDKKSSYEMADEILALPIEEILVEEDLREKIDEKTGCEYMKCTDFKKGVCYYKYPYCKYRPEDDLFPSFEGVEVEEECVCEPEKDYEYPGGCRKCKGTGKIHRPAVKEDINGAITPTGRRLVIRDEKLNKDQARNNPIEKKA